MRQSLISFWRIVVVIYLSSHCLSVASEIYTAQDAIAIRNLVLSSAGSSGDFGESVENAFYGSGALTLLGAKDKIQYGAICRLLSSQLASELVDLETAFYASQLIGRAGCSDAKAERAAEAVAVGSLGAEAKDIRSAYYALSTLAALGRAAPAKALDSALALLQKLKASKGRLRDTPKGAASLTATAHGYLITAAAQKVGSIGTQHMSVVESLLAGIPQVLETAGGKTFFSDIDADALEAIGRFIQGIETTCSEECSLDQIQLGEVAKMLVRARRLGSVKDAYFFLSGLTLLTTTGKLPKPVAISLVSASAPLSKPEVEVVVQDYTGNVIPIASVEGSLSKGSKGNTKAIKFTSDKPGSYKASLTGLDVFLGTYEVKVAAMGEKNSGKVASEVFQIALTGSVEVPEVTLTVKGADASAAKKKETTLQYPNKLDNALDLDASSQLKVSFSPSFPGSGKGFAPQQVFISLKSRVSGALVLVAAKAAQSSPGDYVATVGPSTIAKQIGTQAGAFDVTLSIGDEALAGLVWQLGSVTVSHAPAGENTAAPTTPQPTAAQLESTPKPEIRHIFRQPDKRPPAVVSLAFTALSATPLLFLLFRLLQIGVNLKGFPSGSAATYAMAFHGGLASILLLYMVFWLRLTLIDTLLPLLVLSVFTFWTGFKTLSHHARAGLKKE